MDNLLTPKRVEGGQSISSRAYAYIYTYIYIYIYMHAGVLPHYPPLPPKRSYPTIHLAPPLFPTKNIQCSPEHGEKRFLSLWSIIESYPTTHQGGYPTIHVPCNKIKEKTGWWVNSHVGSGVTLNFIISKKT